MLALLLMMAGAPAVFVSRGMLKIGYDEMWMRYPIAVLAGYGVLLGLVRTWVEIAKQSFDPDDPMIKEALADDERQRRPHYHASRSRWWEWLDVPSLDFDGGD